MPDGPTSSRSLPKTWTRSARVCVKDKPSHACRALWRAPVIEEMRQCTGTHIAGHLKLVLSIIDRQVH